MKSALKCGIRKQEINLIDPVLLEVPDEALAALSYGTGFIPTPKFDQFRFRLDGYNAKNKLERFANEKGKSLTQVVEEDLDEDTVEGINFIFPRELAKRPISSQVLNCHYDSIVEQVLNGIGSFTDTFIPPKISNNLNVLERKGLRWLKTHTANNSVCV